jgi:hypothetical protein
MGMYTKISVDLKFKENLPTEVVEALKAMVGEVDSNLYSITNFPTHELFKIGCRWSYMLRCSSYYHTPFSLTKLHYDDISKHYYLVSSSDFKNYDNEVELFFDFVKDYVEEGFLGYSLYEENTVPTQYFLQDGVIVKLNNNI